MARKAVFHPVVVALCCMLVGLAYADPLSMEFVAVSAPGGIANTPDTRVQVDGTSGYGSVGYDYRMGKFEVTAGQYRDFLNAVDPTGANPNGVYDLSMDTNAFGCQITWNAAASQYDFSGGSDEAPGSTAADWQDRPVNWIGWYDAARFCNWLTTGNTEEGAYTFREYPQNAALAVVIDRASALAEYGTIYVLPTEDEWYKAAYYAAGLSVYFDYPTGSNALPSNLLNDPDPGNSATYSTDGYDGGFTIGSPYFRTQVGAYVNSASPYGTFDQGGNVQEWNETLVDGSHRGNRGGSAWYRADAMLASARNRNNPTGGDEWFGFRVASLTATVIPEPGSLGLLALGACVCLLRRRRGA